MVYLKFYNPILKIIKQSSKNGSYTKNISSNEKF